MYPHERSLVKKLKDQPFVLIGINSDPDRDSLKKRMSEENITWNSWWDENTSGKIAKAWNVRGWPTVYLVDAKGVIRFKSTGFDEKRFDSTLDALLVEMGVDPKSLEPKSDDAKPEKDQKPGAKAGD